MICSEWFEVECWPDGETPKSWMLPPIPESMTESPNVILHHSKDGMFRWKVYEPPQANQAQ